MGLPFENADYTADEVGARKMNELTDVVLTNIQNDNVLVYNNGIWENQAQSGGSIINELNDIPGVTITSVVANQVLKYVGGVWVNSTDTDANTDNLNDLTDTLLTTPFGDDEVIKYSGGKWKNGNIPIEKLSNVHISNLQDGETLRYVLANTRWENAYNIDTLNELSDVTISSNLNNHVLKYNHTDGVYKNAYLNVTDLGDTNITTLANGNTLIYNNGEWAAGNISLSNFTNGTGISVTGTSPNFTITNTSPDQVVTFNNGTGINVTGNYPTFTITNTYQETDPIYTNSDAANVTNAKIAKWDAAWGWGDHSAQNYIKNIAPLHVDIPNLKVGINQASPVVDFQVGTTMYVNNTAGKVGIGIAVPTSQLEINGDLQIDSSVEARLKFYHSGSSAHTLSEITAEKDGTNGGDLHFYTKVNNGNVTEKLRINNIGAIGIGATPNYGTANQFLKSNNSGSAVSWDTPTDTTYSATGTGLSLTGTIFQNTAPDQTVTLTGTGGTTTSGTYPSFTINSTDTNTTYSATGTGLSLNGTVFENTKPDQTVTLTGTGGTTTSGTYPSFTINSTDTNTTYSATGTGLSLTGTAFQNTAPDQVVTLTGTGGTTTSGTYPNFTINSTDTDTTYVGGTAITVTNNAISNDAPDQIVVLTGTGGTTTSGTYPSFTINSTDTNTTYSAGLNMSLVGTEFNIPQSIGTFDSPSFNTLTLGNGGANLGVINLRDTTNIGIETVAQMKGILNVTNGGQLEFQTKVNGGILTKKMVISENGKTEFFTDTGTISILSADGTSQQSFIYNDTNGTRDLTFDCYSAVTNKGISFLTGGVRRMRITNTGEFLFGASNSAGNTNDVLTSSGGVGPPYWAPVAVQGGVYTGGLGISVTNNVISIDNVVVNTYANQQISGNKSFTDAMGIGITGASSWPLRVAQYGATIGGSLGQYVYGNGGWGYAGYYWSSSNPTDAIGLYVDEGIRCGRQFILSDRRIKKDIIDINDEQALLKLRLLKPKRYKYIDPRRGTDEVYGFIAQEVAEVIPYSVNLEKSYIPSHMVFCKIITTTTTTTTLDTKVPHNLTTTDVISIRDSSHVLTEDIKVVEIINDKTLKIDKVFTTTETTFIASSGQTETNVIFLYGKKVADLHAINKDTIWTTATAALQEVDRQLQAEKIKTLNLTSRLEALEARLLALESK